MLRQLEDCRPLEMTTIPSKFWWRWFSEKRRSRQLSAIASRTKRVAFSVALVLFGLSNARELLAAGASNIIRYDSFSLRSGSDVLAITGPGNNSFESVVVFDADNPARRCSNLPPLNLECLGTNQDTHWLGGHYSSVVNSNKTLRCQGEIKTPAGSLFEFEDVYSLGPVANTFRLDRKVLVKAVAAADAGFATRFSLHEQTALPLREHELFMPAVAYARNEHVSPRALLADYAEETMLVREDRLPLPLAMMMNPRTGTTVALTHLAPDGNTCLADYTAGRLVGARLQFASLGFYSQTNPAVALCYPGTEGTRTYLRRRGFSSGSETGAERFHPVITAVRHEYSVLISVGHAPDFPQAMRQTWREAFDQSHPVPAPVHLGDAYGASIQLLKDWSQTHNGCSGLPFRLELPAGRLMAKTDWNFQMGFVGQQLPLAFHLLRYGLLHEDTNALVKGEAMVDFWATNSPTTNGLPRTWFDVYPQPHWRHYNTFLRVASDGMDGALRAWAVMASHHCSKPEWLCFCRGYGDWLVQHQNADGSWFREYDWQSQPVDFGKQNTTHPIRFLVDLWMITGDDTYRQAALRAGAFAWQHVHEAFAYVGGTVDNPNVIDKEAGFLAMDAFLALHDLTGEKSWLNAATQAADFTETWAYAWNVPIPTNDPQVTYPTGATTTGLSIIATGHSGADLFLAGAPFLFYRLYLQTGDIHYAEIARQLLYDTKQAVDINGSLGYGHPGLCTEALSLAPPRGHGVNVWLPWLTFSMIDPLVQLEDAYGRMNAPIVSGADRERLRLLDRKYAANHGLPVELKLK